MRLCTVIEKFIEIHIPFGWPRQGYFRHHASNEFSLTLHCHYKPLPAHKWRVGSQIRKVARDNKAVQKKPLKSPKTWSCESLIEKLKADGSSVTQFLTNQIAHLRAHWRHTQAYVYLWVTIILHILHMHVCLCASSVCTRAALISQTQYSGRGTPTIVFMSQIWRKNWRPKKIAINPLRAKPLFSYLKYTAKFGNLRFFSAQWNISLKNLKKIMGIYCKKIHFCEFFQDF